MKDKLLVRVLDTWVDRKVSVNAVCSHRKSMTPKLKSHAGLFSKLND
jgi:hypothetical protein